MTIEINRSYSSRLPAMIMAAASLLVLTACGDGGSGETPPPLVLTKDICFDNSIYAENAKYSLKYLENDSRTIETTGEVRSTNSSYAGVTNLIEFQEVTYNTTVSGVTRYLKPLAPGIVAQYATVAAQGALTLTTTRYSPPLEDRRAEMSPGETRTFIGTGTREVGPLPPNTGPQPYRRQDTIKFVTIERITTPAGTFPACKFEYLDSQTSEWWYRSLVIRRTLADGSKRVLQSGELNGVAIKDL
ncbi:hypothetical protein [Acidovorax radicis]|uniref:hypothetical protein n=1 Tax=Acidovorax radicis TaxID=758826 RepID=UPI001CF9D70C|nr:hypothetical protein [Acidovorax radicis]UCV00668.1 hypothetical protein KI609_07925 [Acidovorax radicis]